MYILTVLYVLEAKLAWAVTLYLYPEDPHQSTLSPAAPISCVATKGVHLC